MTGPDVWLYPFHDAAELAQRLADAFRFDVIAANARKISDELAAMFARFDAEDMRRADLEKRTRVRRSWSAKAAPRVADVPRRIAWTASLRAFS